MVIPPASADIYQRHAKELIGYASALVGPSNAEDIVADAMVKLLTKVDLSTVDNPRAYLFRCVLNQVRESRRVDRARRRREWTVGHWTAASSSTAKLDPAAALHDFGLLTQLSTRERSVVYLTYWEDMTVADVARTLGLTDGSVRRYLARARKKLRRQLSDPAAAVDAQTRRRRLPLRGVER